MAYKQLTANMKLNTICLVEFKAKIDIDILAVEREKSSDVAPKLLTAAKAAAVARFAG